MWGPHRHVAWAAHKIANQFLPIHFCHYHVVLVVFFGSLMRCHVNSRLSPKSHTLCIHPSCNSGQSPYPYCWKAPPQHDATTIMPHCVDGIKPGDEQCLVFIRHSAWSSAQRVSFLSHQIREYFSSYCQSSLDVIGKLQVGCHIYFTSNLCKGLLKPC